jgi:hypothetical protein
MFTTVLLYIGWVLLKNPVTGEGTGEICISVIYLVSARAGASDAAVPPEIAKVPAAAFATPPTSVVSPSSPASVLASSISASSSSQSSDDPSDHLSSDSDLLKSDTHLDEAVSEASGDVEKAEGGEVLEEGDEDAQYCQRASFAFSTSSAPCHYYRPPPPSTTMLKRMRSVASLPSTFIFSGSGEAKSTTAQTTAVTDTPAALSSRTHYIPQHHHSQEGGTCMETALVADRVDNDNDMSIPEECEDTEVHSCQNCHDDNSLEQSDMPTPSPFPIIAPSDHGDLDETGQGLPVLLWLSRPIAHEHLIKMVFIDRICASSPSTTKAQTRPTRRRASQAQAQGPPVGSPCWAGASPRTIRWRLSQVFGRSLAGAGADEAVVAV